jgi:hypothetical protein
MIDKKFYSPYNCSTTNNRTGGEAKMDFGEKREVGREILSLSNLLYRKIILLMTYTITILCFFTGLYF